MNVGTVTIVLICVFLLVYLGVALLRPERF
jgi:K+-transporting ATPase KdpF subunit